MWVDMWKQQLPVMVAIAVLVLVAQRAQAQTEHKQQDASTLGTDNKQQLASKVPITLIERISEIKRPHTSVQWLSQSPVQVRGVRLNPTPDGLEVILETPKGQQLQASTRGEGNSLIADISNAVLALPQGGEFRANNPVAANTSVTVTQLDANRISVRVTGKERVPTARVTQNERGLVFSLTPAANTTANSSTPTPLSPDSAQPFETVEEDESIEIVVTGEQESGYRVPNATTGTRTDTPIRDIPQSIQVVPEQVLKDQQVTRVGNALQNVSGVVN